MFWFIVLTAFFFYGTAFSAMGIASGFMQEKYGFTNVSAGFLLVKLAHYYQIVNPTDFGSFVFPCFWSSGGQIWISINELYSIFDNYISRCFCLPTYLQHGLYVSNSGVPAVLFGSGRIFPLRPFLLSLRPNSLGQSRVTPTLHFVIVWSLIRMLLD